jgi:hypothetical protein
MKTKKLPIHSINIGDIIQCSDTYWELVDKTHLYRNSFHVKWKLIRGFSTSSISEHTTYDSTFDVVVAKPSCSPCYDSDCPCIYERY